MAQICTAILPQRKFAALGEPHLPPLPGRATHPLTSLGVCPLFAATIHARAFQHQTCYELSPDRQLLAQLATHCTGDWREL